MHDFTKDPRAITWEAHRIYSQLWQQHAEKLNDLQESARTHDLSLGEAAQIAISENLLIFINQQLDNIKRHLDQQPPMNILSPHATAKQRVQYFRKNQGRMSNEAYFKFLVLMSLDEYTELDGEDLMAVATAYTCCMGNPLDYTLNYNVRMLKAALDDAACSHILEADRLCHPDNIDDGKEFLKAVISERCDDLGISLA